MPERRKVLSEPALAREVAAVSPHAHAQSSGDSCGMSVIQRFGRLWLTATGVTVGVYPSEVSHLEESAIEGMSRIVLYDRSSTYLVHHTIPELEVLLITSILEGHEQSTDIAGP